MTRNRTCPVLGLWTLMALILLVMLLAGCGLRATGQSLVQDRCTRCHTLAPIEVASKTQLEWQNTVYRMIEHGAKLSDSQAMRAVDYLVESHGPTSP